MVININSYLSHTTLVIGVLGTRGQNYADIVFKVNHSG